MDRTNPVTRDANLLLAGLPERAFARLSPHFEVRNLALYDVLFEAGAPMEYVYFPDSGCLSMLAVMKNGQEVEVGTIGREGMTGVSFLHRADAALNRCIVQVEGHATRIARAPFLAELRASQSLRRRLEGFAEAWTFAIGRSGACNAVHTVEQRCARWLLMTLDRMGSDVIPITQELLAIMLGVRRASVTSAAAALQNAGLIRYRRGKVTVIDRVGLEAASCECYREIRDSYDRAPARSLP